MPEVKDELNLEASDENLDRVLDFVDGYMERYGCDQSVQLAVDVAVEELFVNIAHYAYTPDRGSARVGLEIREPRTIIISFTDQGKQYDPLAKPDPDLTLPVEERPIGGLGIYMVKQSMDKVTYTYENKSNILTIQKNMTEGKNVNDRFNAVVSRVEEMLEPGEG